jgi:2,3-bisphosphoglycerate-independent phosphoglycerate mutase
MDLNVIQDLIRKNQSKIVLLVMDGIGGAPEEEGGPTELEAADSPNLDQLASRSICGLHEPVGPGITPGSGPGHLALFGYNPLKYQVGRGVLAALGIGFDLQHGDVAARGNFCTIDANGKVTDRRAGRISNETNQKLVAMLREIEIPGVEVFVETVKEHRFLLVLRGKELKGSIADTDPQETGKEPLKAKAKTEEAEYTAGLVNQFLEKARDVLKDQHPANMIVTRGFAERPDWPTFGGSFGLKAAAIAAYPMYRGVAKLVGMEVVNTGSELEDEFETLKQRWDEFDFFFLHVKPTDSSGEDGDFERKKGVVERVDKQIPGLLELNPDVLVITGDHSTPSILKSHGWQPVPTLLNSRLCRPDNVKTFGERACIGGGLGPAFPAENLLPLALANAERLEKFGA